MDRNREGVEWGMGLEESWGKGMGGGEREKTALGCKINKSKQTNK